MFFLPWELLFLSSTKVEVEWRKDAFRKRQGSSGPINIFEGHILVLGSRVLFFTVQFFVWMCGGVVWQI